MNMRWAWTLPVLTACGPVLTAGGILLPATSASAQMGAPAPATAPMAAPPWAAASPQLPPPTANQPLAMAPASMPAAAAMPAGYPQQAYLPAPAGYAPGYAPQGFAAAPYNAAAGPMQPSPYAPMAMPAGYVGGPMPGVPTPAMGAPPSGATPDVYGSYGYVPMDGGQGYGGQAYGPPGYDQTGISGMPGAPAYGGDLYGGGMPGGGMPGGPMDGGLLGGGESVCPYCNGQGCPYCGPGGPGGRHGLHGGLLGDLLGWVAPYPDGGCGAPRWFDFAVDFMMLKRDNTGRNIDLTSAGLGGPPNAPIVLSTNNLDFGDYRPGFRFIGALQVGPSNSLEFTYFGQFNYHSAATATSATGNLFSVLSGFGTVPPFGFTETDAADFQRINYYSSFDSFEVNWRKRWMAPNCRYQGSWTIGVRNFLLNEKFQLDSSSSTNGIGGDPTNPATARFNTVVNNCLTGLQIGTDAWICIVPGFRIGTELQAGVYGNHVHVLNTAIVNDVLNSDFRETVKTNDVSFLGQANFLATYRLNYQWSLRAGYQLLYVDGVALATENFNTTPPRLFGNTRQPMINDNGNVFWHGWNIGAEYMW